MKDKLEKALEDHTITIHSDNNLYVSDYKHYINHYGVPKYDGKVVILNFEPNDWKSIHIQNTNNTEVCFDGFEENALPLAKGESNKQCECVLFPCNKRVDKWILFIETKYSDSFENAFREENNYPYSMTEQIIETVKYFRKKKIIQENKKVHAIVSFPKLVEEFNSYIFNGKISIEDIFVKHKIIIRGTKKAKIISDKRIKI